MPADHLSVAAHAFLPGERSDPLGKTDSVAAGGGVSTSERCLFARRAAGDPPGKTDSVAAGGGVSASERCLFARRTKRSAWQNGQRSRRRRSERRDRRMGSYTAHKFTEIGLQDLGRAPSNERCHPARKAAGDPQFSKHSRFPMRYPADSIFKYSPAVPVKYSMEDISET